MNEERVLDLVRLRLLVRGRLRGAALADSLRPYVDDGSPWRERWEALLDRLESGGELERETLALTPKGVERALGAIGLRSLPPRARFQSLVQAYLVPRALGVSDERARKRVAKADGLRAAILAGESGATPTLQQAVDALVWKALGFPADGALTVNKLRERVLSRELGDGRAIPLERAKRLAAAKAAGARRTDSAALAEAVVRRWVGSRDASHDLASFSRAVLEAARDRSTKRFTDEKAFIESVWERVRDERGAPDLPSFKAQLLEAHRRGLLVLSRADLTQLIDPRELAASEITVDGAAFHFVRTDAPEASP